MGVADTLSIQLEGIFNNWSKAPIKDEADELSIVYKNACEAAFEFAMADETQHMETTKGTLFGAYNAVTGFTLLYEVYFKIYILMDIRARTCYIPNSFYHKYMSDNQIYT